MGSEGDLVAGIAFLAVLGMAAAAGMFLHRRSGAAGAGDSEDILTDLRISAENATAPCRLKEISSNPRAFSGRAQGSGVRPDSNYRTVRFEIFDHGSLPPAETWEGQQENEAAGWRCSQEAAAAGVAHYDRDEEKELELLFLILQAGEGVYEAVYCKAGLSEAGGGILKLSFNGRHLGIVNFSADGTISDSANRRVGSAQWAGTSLIASLGSSEYTMAGPVFEKSPFRVAGHDADASALPEGHRMLLVCLSLFNQTYWRAKRAAKSL